MIAPAAEEMSLQSLRLLVNASKPAGARSISVSDWPSVIALRALREAGWVENAELN